MRTSIRIGRGRGLVMAASVLLAGAAIAAATIPEQAAPAAAAVAKVTVTNPGPQTTTPLGSEVDLPITATDTDPAGLPLTFTATALPAGLGIDPSSGVIGGVVSASFSAPVTVTATDQNGVKSAATFTWTAEDLIAVTSPGTQVTPLETVVHLPIAATDNAGVNATLAYADGGTLPAGLAINPVTGVISGVVTTPGTYPVKITASDGTGSPNGSVSFTWHVGNVITVKAPTSEQSIVGTAIAPVTITATDTTPGLKFAYTATGLPKGLGIAPATGVISGTPTAVAETYSVEVTATDSTGASGTAVIDWTIGTQHKIDVTAPKAKTIYLGVTVKLQPSVTDSDTADKAFTWTAAPLPRGLTISKTGLISGRPTQAGASKTVVTVKDATGSVGIATISWKVTGAVSIVDLTPKVKTTTVGQGADLKFASKDAVPGDKQTFSATGLPPGLALSQQPFLLWGWPTKAGNYTVTIHEKGSLGSSGALAVKLAVPAAPGKGATGQIRLALDGKCLQDPGNKTSNGAKVEITNCIAGSTEKWTVASDGTIRVNGRCLDISGTSYKGKAVALWACNGSVRELWTQGTKGLLVNPASGLCVTDPGSSTKNGAVPAMGSCAIKGGEQWTLPAQPILASVGGFCADDYHSLGYNNSIVDVYSCNGTPGQAWAFEPDGTIRQSQYPKVCLTDHGTPGKAGVKLTLWLCQKGDKAQQWSVARAGGLGSEVTLGGVCLGIASLSAQNGTQLVTAKCGKTSPLVLWHIA